MLITGVELRLTLDVACKPVNFLMNMRATYSVLTAHSVSVSSETCLVVGINRAPRFGVIFNLFLVNDLYLGGKVKQAKGL